MDRSVFVLLLLSGLFWSSSAQYHFINVRMSWSEAQSYCRQRSTDLVTVDTMEDVDGLMKAVDAGYSGSVWIGLKRGTQKCSGWSNGENTQYFNWASGETMIVTLGTGLDKAVIYSIICYGGMFGGYCLLPQKFYYVPEGMTWNQAQSHCKMKYNDLAFVSSEEDLDKLKASIPPYIDKIWIRGFDLNSDSNSTESDNSTTSTTLESNCIGIDTSFWKLIRKPCQRTFTFYCSQYEGKRVLMRMKLTPDGKVDLKDPVVKAKVLAKINEKFNNLGFGDAVKIRWFAKQERLTKMKKNNTCS